ncbi:AraC family transcriptional regulator [Paenibacillus thalictri]|uniref:AraC family transcriptional regulator n=1 Tax=Paenibacillus thalictri TaxID=2527873 RepID=A0A4Q9DHW3_9BACL|nr:AraC family transcriptional regulator [Paenibacillus thalictri]TBL70779.1 AraC family transcriptional regulator [Paenibacillus thalictri]
MEWLTRMTAAIDYMEERMTEKLDIAEISKTAYSSPFHFQRMFHMLTGFTVAEYIRNRRLTLAAQELAVSKDKVVDVALKYGYDSPESFSKAFRKAHGITPSDARDSGAGLKAFPRIAFQLTLKGDKEMDYKIVDKPAFTIVGKSIEVSMKEGENFREIPRFWQQSNSDGTVAKLCALAPDKDVLGVCLSSGHHKETFYYAIAIESSADAAGGEFTATPIPALSWAVFTSVGPMPGAIQNVWKRIFGEWFPATGYEHADGPELEVYPPGDTQAENYRCEIWVPIIKKP